MTPTSSVTQMRARASAQQPEALRQTLDALLPRLCRRSRPLGDRTRQPLFIARGTSDNAAVYGRHLTRPRRPAFHASPRPDRHRLPQSAPPGGRSGRRDVTVRPDRGDRRDLGLGPRLRRRTVAVTNGGGYSPSPRSPTSHWSTMRVRSGRARPPIRSRPNSPRSPARHRPRRRGRPRRTPRYPDESSACCRPEPDLASERWPNSPPAAGVVVSGRGLAFSAALERALKLEEGLLHAMGLSYADLLHGRSRSWTRRPRPSSSRRMTGPRSRGRSRLPPGARARAPRVRHRWRTALGPACTRALPGPAARMARADRLIVRASCSPRLSRAGSESTPTPPVASARSPRRSEQGHPDELSKVTQTN